MTRDPAGFVPVVLSAEAAAEIFAEQLAEWAAEDADRDEWAAEEGEE